MIRRISTVFAVGWIVNTSFAGIANAGNLNLFGGSNVGSGETGLAVAEYVLPYIAEVGPFFEWSRNSKDGPENRYFVGLVGRLPTPWLNFFADARAGYNWNSTPPGISHDNGFNLEFGVGYRFTFPALDILPRVGLSAYTANENIPTVNLSAGVAIVL